MVSSVVLFLLILRIAFARSELNDTCITTNNRVGRCVTAKDCQFALDILRSKHNTPEQYYFIEHNKCGQVSDGANPPKSLVRRLRESADSFKVNFANYYLALRYAARSYKMWQDVEFQNSQTVYSEAKKRELVCTPGQVSFNIESAKGDFLYTVEHPWCIINGR